ncbi:SCA7-domain-containing protein [Amylocystis lapponica]|nr:SCA7-domain-containing protein [Amylocystis lapponica]
MKLFGSEPLKSEIGVVKCKDCGKPVLRSAIVEHADNCAKIRGGGKKGAKGKVVEPEGDAAKKGKKRKAEDEDPNPDDPSLPKKKKPATKVTKGRFKGPVDYDKQCGVINDKGLPCSRSLTCKSHSMGAKRAVQGRSKPYDELLLQWNRLNNPNWVEPVKKESKAERKERKEREKAEKKRLAQEAALAAGIDPSKKAPSAAAGIAGPKKSKKSAVAHAAAVAAAANVANGEDAYENLDDIDSDAEVDSLVRAVHVAQSRGVIGVPLAVPCDAGSFFVTRRERLRTCRELLAQALMPTRSVAGAGVARMG